MKGKSSTEGFSAQGYPMRANISDMGPLLLSRLLKLNDTQEGVLNIAFKLSDDHGMALLDLKDLRALMTFVAEQSQELTALYGNVSKASVGAIQRRLLQLEQQGGDQFFGEPALELADLMRCDAAGRGQLITRAEWWHAQRPRSGNLRNPKACACINATGQLDGTASHSPFRSGTTRFRAAQNHCCRELVLLWLTKQSMVKNTKENCSTLPVNIRRARAKVNCLKTKSPTFSNLLRTAQV